ncbi:MAG: rhamnan synthesis F family protein [Akkermansia sp.]
MSHCVTRDGTHPKILTHVHVYYQDMWPELAQKLQSVQGCELDLQITVTQEDETFKSTILTQFPRASVSIVENRGFDIRPFVQLIQRIHLDSYDYVIKIHTKRDTAKNKIGKRILLGSDWRNASLSFLDSPEIFAKNISYFENNPQCGMIASHLLTLDIATNCTSINQERLGQLLNDYQQTPVPHSCFVAGTMFMARASAMKPLQALDPDAFEEYVQRDGLFAHTVERFMGHIIYAQGMSIQDPNKNNPNIWAKFLLASWKNKFPSFIYSAAITHKDRLSIKIIKIPLPYCLSELLFPSYKKRLLKEKQKVMQYEHYTPPSDKS